MKIRAAVLDHMGASHPYAVSKPLRIATIDLDPPGRGEVLVKIAAAGLCHSDLSVINGDRPRPTPMALGHEACATVEVAGDPDGSFKPGDRVVLSFLPACGECPSCAAGEGYMCAVGYSVSIVSGAATVIALLAFVGVRKPFARAVADRVASTMAPMEFA